MNPEENQETTTTIEDLKLPDHLLLSFSDDEFLSKIIEELLNSLNDPPEFAEIMNFLVFDGHDLDELQQVSFYENPACSKCIPGDEMYYICFDCDISPHPNVYSLFCEECFDKSNHKGHRIYIMRSASGSANCDCGDAQFIKPEGFCSDHKSKPINIQELYENFPQELRVKFERLTKKSIYAVVSLIELEKVPALADRLMSEMLSFWSECYSDINRAFLPILWTTLRSKFESPYDLVWHDCEDLKAENKYSQGPHKCTCSLLGSLLRISNLINKENQEKLKKTLLACVKDRDFLEYFAIELVKYLHYFFIQNTDEEISQVSAVFAAHVQLYQEDNVLLKVLDSGYFENFLKLIKRLVDNCAEVNETTSQIIAEIEELLNFFLMWIHTSSHRLVQDEKFTLLYLDIVMTYQMKFYYTEKLTMDLFDHQINYDSINVTLDAERSLCKPLEKALKVIFDLALDEQKNVTRLFLKHWYLNLQNAKAALKAEDSETPCQSFNSCLERLFCCIMINYMGEDISSEKLQKFVKENFESEINIIEGSLRALGMIRYLHLTFSYNSGHLLYKYYSARKAFFEIDVVTTQMMVLLLEPEKGLFELLIENFFSYSQEIIGFFKDPNVENYDKKKLTMIEDFLYFLVFLMTDETCMLNVQTRYKKDAFAEIKLNQRQRQVAKNLLVNILRGSYWTTTQQTTEIFHNFLTTDQEFDQILLEITVKDEKNHKIRIKDEYEGDLNPYTFYRMPAIRQEMIETFTAKSSKKTDLVAGEPLDKDIPQYLKDIQIKLYQSNLPEFLCKYLKTMNSKSGTTLVDLVLKLILLNLQVAEESSILKQKVEINYQNDDFQNIIDNLSMEEGFKDCRNCIEKIHQLLQKSKAVIRDLSPQKDEKMAQKKLSAQERMAQLKQDFAKKQAAFAQNNQSLLQVQVSEESKKDDHPVCQHCLEKLYASGQEYGLPINITFTNNFYLEDSIFLKQDYIDFLKANWWPVVSSCHHYYHRKCFEVFFKAPKDIETDFLGNAYEFLCPLCKGLSNNFLSINGGEGEKGGEKVNEEVAKDELKAHPQIYETFSKKVQNILDDLKTKIQDYEIIDDLGELVPVGIIFERAYQYFIESFYLLENAQSLEKSFELYLVFFKSLKKACPEIQSPEEKNLQNSFSLEAVINSHVEIEIPKLLAKNFFRSSKISGKCEMILLKNFIAVKMIQTIALNNSPFDKIEDYLSLYQSNRAFIHEQLTFPIQKIILAYAMKISPANLSDLFNLLQNTTSYQEEYLTDLLHAVGISSSSFPEFVVEIFQELSNDSLLKLRLLKPHKIKFAPRMIQLPENYLKFNTTYFIQKCSLCNKHSVDFRLSICLICGDVMCACYCGNDDEQAGNLNRHSRKYHMGMGVFLDIEALYRNMISAPLNLNTRTTSLYVNKVGQDVVSHLYGFPKDIAKLDFAEFKINQEYLKELAEMINHQALRKEVVAAGMRTGEKAEDGFL